MTMAELLQRVKDAGASAEVLTVVAVCFEEMSGTSPGQVRDIARKYERERKRDYRKNHPKIKANAEANDAARASEIVRDKSGTTSENHCDLTSLPSLLSEEATKKVSKKGRGDTRARGTRLAPDAVLSDANRQFAIEQGASDPDGLWIEFRDYWIGVPGQRGTKLDWDATWRNRVRAVASKGKPHGYRNGSAPRTELQLAIDKARQYARGGDQGNATVPEDEFGNRH